MATSDTNLPWRVRDAVRRYPHKTYKQIAEMLRCSVSAVQYWSPGRRNAAKTNVRPLPPIAAKPKTEESDIGEPTSVVPQDEYDDTKKPFSDTQLKELSSLHKRYADDAFLIFGNDGVVSEEDILSALEHPDSRDDVPVYNGLVYPDPDFLEDQLHNAAGETERTEIMNWATSTTDLMELIVTHDSGPEDHAEASRPTLDVLDAWSESSS